MFNFDDPYFLEWRAKMASQGLTIFDVGVGTEFQKWVDATVFAQIMDMISSIPLGMTLLKVEREDFGERVVAVQKIKEGRVEIGFIEDYPPAYQVVLNGMKPR